MHQLFYTRNSAVAGSRATLHVVENCADPQGHCRSFEFTPLRRAFVSC